MNLLRVPEFDLKGGKLQSGFQLSEEGHYAVPRMQVNKKTRLRVEAELRPQIADGIRAARKSLGLTQASLAEALGSSQGAITRWEREIDSPPVAVFNILAKLVPDEQRDFWLQLSGDAYRDLDMNDLRSIPVLHDAAAAGTPRVVDENEIDFNLLFPPKLLPSGGKLVGVRVSGDSMSPILEDGYIALLDVSQRQPSKLVGKMVAARQGDGITLKWLRRQKGDIYLLVPQNTSQRHDIEFVSQEGDWSIVGEVVKWIGQPHLPKRK